MVNADLGLVKESDEYHQIMNYLSFFNIHLVLFLFLIEVGLESLRKDYVYSLLCDDNGAEFFVCIRGIRLSGNVCLMAEFGRQTKISFIF